MTEERIKVEETQDEQKISTGAKVVDILMKHNAVIILIVLVVISSIISDAFLTQMNIFNLTRHLVPLTFAALGMLMVILTGGIDLSVGSNTALGGMICGMFIVNYGMTSHGGLAFAIAAALAVGFIAGSMTGFFVVGLKMAPFVATLATMTIARGAAFMTTFGQPLRLPLDEPATEALAYFGARSEPIFGIPWPVVLAIVVILIFVFITRNTVFGRLVIASGSNETAVRLAGIQVSRYKFFAYAISGMLCAAAGVITTARVIVAAPSIATGLELDAIAACVIGGASLSGGKGTVLNTVIGVMVLGLITNVMSLMGVGIYTQQIARGVIIVLAVFVQHITSSREKTSII